MRAFAAMTSEIGDTDYLCDDLAKQIDANVKFGSRSIGILLCDSTVDYQTVVKSLYGRYSFDIYGCTALAFMHADMPEEPSVSFLVVTGDDDLSCSIALSDPLTTDNYADVIAATYKRALEQLNEDPKLLLTLQPYSTNLTPDNTTDILDRLSNHCPEYGAISSCDLESNISCVFFNGKAYHDRLLLVLLGGKIRPVFAAATAEVSIPPVKAVITEAEENVVRRVGEYTFLEFMKQNGLFSSPTEVLSSCIATYASSPIITFSRNTFDSQPKLRHIVHIDYETGAVAFTGRMSEGHAIAICVLTSDQVRKSAQTCFIDLQQKMQKNVDDGYTYSLLLATSCGSRYLVLSGDTTIESSFIKNSELLNPLAACGFYAMGEICPIGCADGIALNRSLHSSLTLMAL